ncbi:MAG: sigma-70 family RNA polymerase sigma factor [Aerococcus sp.]|nr:sigma-70 family RNA polymerase sigma factor [Aerococcus sp.]
MVATVAGGFDNEFFETLLKRYERLIHYTLSRAAIAQTVSDYDDLAQELRLKLCDIALIAPCHPLAESARFTGFAKPRLYHYLIDLRRGHYRKRSHYSSDAWLEETAWEVGCDQQEELLTRSVINQTRAGLDEEEQQLFDRLVLDDWTLKEIAEDMHLSIAAISKRRARLRWHLRPLLRTYQNE